MSRIEREDRESVEAAERQARLPPLYGASMIIQTPDDDRETASFKICARKG
jgi:hypothetical protein